MPSPAPEKSIPSVSPQQLQLESERMQEVVLLVDNLLRQEETILGLIVDCLYDIGSVRLIQQKLTVPFLQGPTRGVARVSKPLFRLLALRWIKKNCPELLAKWLYSKVIFEEEPAPQPEAKPEPETLPSVKASLENPDPIEEISEQISSPPPIPAEVEVAIETGKTPAIPPNYDRPTPSATGTLPHLPPPADNHASSAEDAPTVSPPSSQALVPVTPPPPPQTAIAPPISLEEYNRAIAQLKYRDTEITKLQTRSKLLAGLLVILSVALGGALFWPLYGPELGLPSKAEPVQSRQ